MTEPFEKIKRIKDRHEKDWLRIEEVVAVGIGKTSEGSTGLIVSVKENAGMIREKIPAMIEDVVIEIRETGEIKAL
jgi:hypothetical protein